MKLKKRTETKTEDFDLEESNCNVHNMRKKTKQIFRLLVQWNSNEIFTNKKVYWQD